MSDSNREPPPGDTVDPASPRLRPHAGERPGPPPVDDPASLIRWALRRFRGWRTVATTGLGMEGCVLLDLLAAEGARIDVLFIDTGFLFPETLELERRIGRRYPTLRLRTLRPELSPEEQALRHGDALWRRDPDLCCSLRKVAPLAPALEGVDVWFTGLRRSQTQRRAALEPVSWDWERQLLKVSPLARWSREQVWRWARDHDVPVNPLHQAGYPSIGCTHCTRPVAGAGPATDSRAGRWSDFDKTECGLHGRPGFGTGPADSPAIDPSPDPSPAPRPHGDATETHRDPQ